MGSGAVTAGSMGNSAVNTEKKIKAYKAEQSKILSMFPKVDKSHSGTALSLNRMHTTLNDGEIEGTYIDNLISLHDDQNKNITYFISNPTAEGKATVYITNTKTNKEFKIEITNIEHLKKGDDLDSKEICTFIDNRLRNWDRTLSAEIEKLTTSEDDPDDPSPSGAGAGVGSTDHVASTISPPTPPAEPSVGERLDQTNGKVPTAPGTRTLAEPGITISRTASEVSVTLDEAGTVITRADEAIESGSFVTEFKSFIASVSEPGILPPHQSVYYLNTTGGKMSVFVDEKVPNTDRTNVVVINFDNDRFQFELNTAEITDTVAEITDTVTGSVYDLEKLEAKVNEQLAHKGGATDTKDDPDDDPPPSSGPPGGPTGSGDGSSGVASPGSSGPPEAGAGSGSGSGSANASNSALGTTNTHQGDHTSAADSEAATATSLETAISSDSDLPAGLTTDPNFSKFQNEVLLSNLNTREFVGRSDSTQFKLTAPEDKPQTLNADTTEVEIKLPGMRSSIFTRGSDAFIMTSAKPDSAASFSEKFTTALEIDSPGPREQLYIFQDNTGKFRTVKFSDYKSGTVWVDGKNDSNGRDIVSKQRSILGVRSQNTLSEMVKKVNALNASSAPTPTHTDELPISTPALTLQQTQTPAAEAGAGASSPDLESHLPRNDGDGASAVATSAISHQSSEGTTPADSKPEKAKTSFGQLLKLGKKFGTDDEFNKKQFPASGKIRDHLTKSKSSSTGSAQPSQSSISRDGAVGAGPPPAAEAGASAVATSATSQAPAIHTGNLAFALDGEVVTLNTEVKETDDGISITVSEGYNGKPVNEYTQKVESSANKTEAFESIKEKLTLQLSADGNSYDIVIQTSATAVSSDPDLGTSDSEGEGDGDGDGAEEGYLSDTGSATQSASDPSATSGAGAGEDDDQVGPPPAKTGGDGKGVHQAVQRSDEDAAFDSDTTDREDSGDKSDTSTSSGLSSSSGSHIETDFLSDTADSSSLGSDSNDSGSEDTDDIFDTTTDLELVGAGNSGAATPEATSSHSRGPVRRSLGEGGGGNLGLGIGQTDTVTVGPYQNILLEGIDENQVKITYTSKRLDKQSKTVQRTAIYNPNGTLNNDNLKKEVRPLSYRKKSSASGTDSGSEIDSDTASLSPSDTDHTGVSNIHLGAGATSTTDSSSSSSSSDSEGDEEDARIAQQAKKELNSILGKEPSDSSPTALQPDGTDPFASMDKGVGFGADDGSAAAADVIDSLSKPPLPDKQSVQSGQTKTLTLSDFGKVTLSQTAGSPGIINITCDGKTSRLPCEPDDQDNYTLPTSELNHVLSDMVMENVTHDVAQAMVNGSLQKITFTYTKEDGKFKGRIIDNDKIYTPTKDTLDDLQATISTEYANRHSTTSAASATAGDIDTKADEVTPATSTAINPDKLIIREGEFTIGDFTAVQDDSGKSFHFSNVKYFMDKGTGIIRIEGQTLNDAGEMQAMSSSFFSNQIANQDPKSQQWTIHEKTLKGAFITMVSTNTRFEAITINGKQVSIQRNFHTDGSLLCYDTTNNKKYRIPKEDIEKVTDSHIKGSGVQATLKEIMNPTHTFISRELLEKELDRLDRAEKYPEIEPTKPQAGAGVDHAEPPKPRKPVGTASGDGAASAISGQGASEGVGAAEADATTVSATPNYTFKTDITTDDTGATVTANFAVTENEDGSMTVVVTSDEIETMEATISKDNVRYIKEFADEEDQIKANITNHLIIEKQDDGKLHLVWSDVGNGDEFSDFGDDTMQTLRFEDSSSSGSEGSTSSGASTTTAHSAASTGSSNSSSRRRERIGSRRIDHSSSDANPFDQNAAPPTVPAEGISSADIAPPPAKLVPTGSARNITGEDLDSTFGEPAIAAAGATSPEVSAGAGAIASATPASATTAPEPKTATLDLGDGTTFEFTYTVKENGRLEYRYTGEKDTTTFSGRDLEDLKKTMKVGLQGMVKSQATASSAPPTATSSTASATEPDSKEAEDEGASAMSAVNEEVARFKEDLKKGKEITGDDPFAQLARRKKESDPFTTPSTGAGAATGAGDPDGAASLSGLDSRLHGNDEDDGITNSASDAGDKAAKKWQELGNKLQRHAEIDKVKKEAIKFAANKEAQSAIDKAIAGVANSMATASATTSAAAGAGSAAETASATEPSAGDATATTEVDLTSSSAVSKKEEERIRQFEIGYAHSDPKSFPEQKIEDNKPNHFYLWLDDKLHAAVINKNSSGETYTLEVNGTFIKDLKTREFLKHDKNIDFKKLNNFYEAELAKQTYDFDSRLSNSNAPATTAASATDDASFQLLTPQDLAGLSTEPDLRDTEPMRTQAPINLKATIENEARMLPEKICDFTIAGQEVTRKEIHDGADEITFSLQDDPTTEYTMSYFDATKVITGEDGNEKVTLNEETITDFIVFDLAIQKAIKQSPQEHIVNGHKFKIKATKHGVTIIDHKNKQIDIPWDEVNQELDDKGIETFTDVFDAYKSILDKEYKDLPQKTAPAPSPAVAPDHSADATIGLSSLESKAEPVKKPTKKETPKELKFNTKNGESESFKDIGKLDKNVRVSFSNKVLTIEYEGKEAKVTDSFLRGKEGLKASDLERIALDIKEGKADYFALEIKGKLHTVKAYRLNGIEMMCEYGKEKVKVPVENVTASDGSIDAEKIQAELEARQPSRQHRAGTGSSPLSAASTEPISSTSPVIPADASAVALAKEGAGIQSPAPIAAASATTSDTAAATTTPKASFKGTKEPVLEGKDKVEVKVNDMTYGGEKNIRFTDIRVMRVGDADDFTTVALMMNEKYQGQTGASFETFILDRAEVIKKDSSEVDLDKLQQVLDNRAKEVESQSTVSFEKFRAQFNDDGSQLSLVTHNIHEGTPINTNVSSDSIMADDQTKPENKLELRDPAGTIKTLDKAKIIPQLIEKSVGDLTPDTEITFDCYNFDEDTIDEVTLTITDHGASISDGEDSVPVSIVDIVKDGIINQKAVSDALNDITWTDEELAELGDLEDITLSGDQYSPPSAGAGEATSATTTTVTDSNRVAASPTKTGRRGPSLETIIEEGITPPDSDSDTTLTKDSDNEDWGQTEEPTRLGASPDKTQGSAAAGAGAAAGATDTQSTPDASKDKSQKVGEHTAKLLKLDHVEQTSEAPKELHIDLTINRGSKNKDIISEKFGVKFSGVSVTLLKDNVIRITHNKTTIKVPKEQAIKDGNILDQENVIGLLARAEVGGKDIQAVTLTMGGELRQEVAIITANDDGTKTITLRPLKQDFTITKSDTPGPQSLKEIQEKLQTEIDKAEAPSRPAAPPEPSEPVAGAGAGTTEAAPTDTASAAPKASVDSDGHSVASAAAQGDADTKAEEPAKDNMVTIDPAGTTNVDIHGKNCEIKPISTDSNVLKMRYDGGYFEISSKRILNSENQIDKDYLYQSYLQNLDKETYRDIDGETYRINLGSNSGKVIVSDIDDGEDLMVTIDDSILATDTSTHKLTLTTGEVIDIDKLKQAMPFNEPVEIEFYDDAQTFTYGLEGDDQREISVDYNLRSKHGEMVDVTEGGQTIQIPKSELADSVSGQITIESIVKTLDQKVAEQENQEKAEKAAAKVIVNAAKNKLQAKAKAQRQALREENAATAIQEAYKKSQERAEKKQTEKAKGVLGRLVNRVKGRIQSRTTFPLTHKSQEIKLNDKTFMFREPHDKDRVACMYDGHYFEISKTDGGFRKNGDLDTEQIQQIYLDGLDKFTYRVLGDDTAFIDLNPTDKGITVVVDDVAYTGIELTDALKNVEDLRDFEIIKLKDIDGTKISSEALMKAVQQRMETDIDIDRGGEQTIETADGKRYEIKASSRNKGNEGDLFEITHNDKTITVFRDDLEKAGRITKQDVIDTFHQIEEKERTGIEDSAAAIDTGNIAKETVKDIFSTAIGNISQSRTASAGATDSKGTEYSSTSPATTSDTAAATTDTVARSGPIKNEDEAVERPLRDSAEGAPAGVAADATYGPDIPEKTSVIPADLSAVALAKEGAGIQPTKSVPATGAGAAASAVTSEAIVPSGTQEMVLPTAVGEEHSFELTFGDNVTNLTLTLDPSGLFNVQNGDRTSQFTAADLQAIATYFQPTGVGLLEDSKESEAITATAPQPLSQSLQERLQFLLSGDTVIEDGTRELEDAPTTATTEANEDLEEDIEALFKEKMGIKDRSKGKHKSPFIQPETTLPGNLAPDYDDRTEFSGSDYLPKKATPPPTPGSTAIDPDQGAVEATKPKYQTSLGALLAKGPEFNKIKQDEFGKVTREPSDSRPTHVGDTHGSGKGSGAGASEAPPSDRHDLSSTPQAPAKQGSGRGEDTASGGPAGLAAGAGAGAAPDTEVTEAATPATSNPSDSVGDSSPSLDSRLRGNDGDVSHSAEPAVLTDNPLRHSDNPARHSRVGGNPVGDNPAAATGAGTDALSTVDEDTPLDRGKATAPATTNSASATGEGAAASAVLSDAGAEPTAIADNPPRHSRVGGNPAGGSSLVEKADQSEASPASATSVRDSGSDTEGDDAFSVDEGSSELGGAPRRQPKGTAATGAGAQLHRAGDSFGSAAPVSYESGDEVGFAAPEANHQAAMPSMHSIPEPRDSSPTIERSSYTFPDGKEAVEVKDSENVTHRFSPSDVDSDVKLQAFLDEAAEEGYTFSTVLLDDGMKTVKMQRSDNTLTCTFLDSATEYTFNTTEMPALLSKGVVDPNILTAAIKNSSVPASIPSSTLRDGITQDFGEYKGVNIQKRGQFIVFKHNGKESKYPARALETDGNISLATITDKLKEMADNRFGDAVKIEDNTVIPFTYQYLGSHTVPFVANIDIRGVSLKVREKDLESLKAAIKRKYLELKLSPKKPVNKRPARVAIIEDPPSSKAAVGAGDTSATAPSSPRIIGSQERRQREQKVKYIAQKSATTILQEGVIKVAKDKTLKLGQDGFVKQQKEALDRRASQSTSNAGRQARAGAGAGVGEHATASAASAVLATPQQAPPPTSAGAGSDVARSLDKELGEAGDTYADNNIMDDPFKESFAAWGAGSSEGASASATEAGAGAAAGSSTIFDYEQHNLFGEAPRDYGFGASDGASDVGDAFDKSLELLDDIIKEDEKQKLEQEERDRETRREEGLKEIGFEGTEKLWGDTEKLEYKDTADTWKGASAGPAAGAGAASATDTASGLASPDVSSLKFKSKSQQSVKYKDPEDRHTHPSPSHRHPAAGTSVEMSPMKKTAKPAED